MFVKMKEKSFEKTIRDKYFIVNKYKHEIENKKKKITFTANKSTSRSEMIFSKFVPSTGNVTETINHEISEN